MSTLKRYNQNTKQWEPINQAPATGIYTDNPVLTDGVKSVEDVLIQNKQDIELLRKNVTWLALHGGGGGSGTGGGISGNNATVQIFDPSDNSTDTDEIIWSNNYNNITYKITSNTSTSTYTVYIRVNGVVKHTVYNVKRNSNQIVSSSLLGIGKANATVTITAIDREENEFVKNCKIVIASVKINPIAETKITQSVLKSGDPSFIISFQSSVAGDYKLFWSDSNIYYDESKGWCDARGPLEDSNTQRSQYLDILGLGTTITTKTIKVNNLYESTDADNKVSLFDDPNSVSPGSYVRYFKLVRANNNDLYSETVAAPIVITPADGLLVIPSVGNEKDNKYIVSSDSIMYIKFVTYNGVTSTGTYSFTISVKNSNGEIFPIPLDSNQSINKTFKTPITIPINISAYGDVFKEPGDYEILITAKYGTLTNTGVCYTTVTEPATDVVKKYLEHIDKYAALDLTFWDNTWNTEISDTSSKIQFDNPNFWYYDNGISNTHKAYLDLYNIGADSGLLAGNSVYYKFTHTAAGEISFDKSIRSKIFPKNSEDYDALISGYDYQFSLQLAYSLENITDDTSTVFKMGNYDIETGQGYGVVITAHNYYVKIDDTIMTGVLQDNDFTQFDLVCFRDSNNLKWIYIYQNGILLKAAEHVVSSSGYSLSNINKMYLACSGIYKSGLDVVSQDHINVNFYSTRLYNIPLNDCDIVCSYVNNYANYKRKLEDGSLDPVVISNLLKRNLINTDKAVEEDGLSISQIYDYNNSREQSNYNWGVSYDGTTWQLGGVGDIPNTSNIPVITLTSDWTYDEFIKVGGTMQKVSGTFTYITPGDAENITAEVDMEPQGTTTVNYEIKNLDITFKNNLMFSPKNTWFPEQTFTLKADVVDSAHVNNAAIGTFVNDCFNNDNDGSLFNHSAMKASTIINDYKNVQKTLPSTLTFKPTIEGFPVVLVIAFKKSTGGYDTRLMGIYSFNLGRESYFNQGMKLLKQLRDKNGNIMSQDSASLNFPGLFGAPQAADMPSTDLQGNPLFSCCFEGTRSMNATTTVLSLDSETYDYASVYFDGRENWYPVVYNVNGNVAYDASHYIYDSRNRMIAWNDSNVKKIKVDDNGYFWSPDSSFGSNLFELKYNGGNAQTAWNLFNNSGTASSPYGTSALCDSIAYNLPYFKGGKLRDDGSIIDIWQVAAGGSNDSLNLINTGRTSKIQFPQQPHKLEISFKNSEFYYVVCMLFGLIDNFGKNMQLKYWGNPSSTEQYETWSPTFYDMDTALGVSNIGTEDVPPTVFDESIINLPNNQVKFVYGEAKNALNGYGKTNAYPVFTVHSNKLWGALEHNGIHEKYSLDDLGTNSNWRTYSIVWNLLRSKYITNIEDFLNRYFYSNLELCGQFLYNYDYRTKYLNTPQYAMLHGNRKSFIKSWMTERIAFLDSVFGYKALHGFNDNRLDSASLTESQYLTDKSLLPYNVSWNDSVNIKHNGGSFTMPIMMNKSLITRTVLGGNIHTYKYIQKNTITDIKMCDSVAPGLQTTINNSDCIIDIPNFHNIGFVTLTGSSIGAVRDSEGNNIYEGLSNIKNIYYQFGNLCSLKKFDLSNINTITGEIDLFNTFKTWDNSGFGSETKAFALEELNYANTQTSDLKVNLTGINISSSNIPEIYKSPFTNLNSINISNSKVQSIDIPIGVTLKELNIENSYISVLHLETQPLLKNISFNKCSQLSEIVLTKCNKITDFLLNDTNTQIREITISGCSNLKTIMIETGKKWENVPTIDISDCPKLESIIIKNCTVDGYNENNILRITGTPNLKELTVLNSKFTGIIWDGAENLKQLSKLDLSDCNISRIDEQKYEHEASRNFVNLMGFKSSNFLNEEGIVQIFFKNNSKVTEVYFDNVDVHKNSDGYILDVPEPFILNAEECFANCVNLQRVYGYIHVAGPKIFEKCLNFRINGFTGAISDTIISTKNTVGMDSEKTEGNNGDKVTWIGIINTTSGIRWYHPTDVVLESNGTSYYNLLRKDENGNARYAWICKKPIITTDENGEEVLIKDLKYTNLMISGNNVSKAFSETRCNVWDLYYALFNCDSDEINISGLFSGCDDLDFRWFSDPDPDDNINDNLENNRKDNSPNRYTFINCSGATEVSSVFSCKSLCKIKSPYIDGDKVIPGLFTPFKHKCLTINSPVSGSYVIDRNVFRTLDDSKFCATSIKNISCRYIVEDVNNLSKEAYESEITNFGTSEIFGEVNGNVADMLMDCTNVTVLNGFLENVGFIDYRTACGNSGSIKLPAITSLINSFKTTNAFGELTLQNLFNNIADCGSLKNIYSSFINTIPTAFGSTVEFRLENSTFKNFIELENIAVNPEDSKSGDSFSGDGIHKCISNDGFPYDLFKTCNKLKSVASFFQDLDCTNLTEPIGLPGDLFKSCPNLTDISRLFYNANTNAPCYLTSNSFANCPNLTNVSYAFACDASGKLNMFRTVGKVNNRLVEVNEDENLKACIPDKLFYHGLQSKTTTLYGSNYTEDVTGVEYMEDTDSWQIDKNGVIYNYSGNVEKLSDDSIRINPTTVITENGERIYLVSNISSGADTNIDINDNKVKEITYTVNVPLTNITNMEGCFQGGDWGEYSYKNNGRRAYGLPEDNSEYNPFKYVLNNRVWRINKDYSPWKKTYMWVYDGNWDEYKKYLAKNNEKPEDYEMLDDAHGCEIKNYRVCRKTIGSRYTTNLEMEMVTSGSTGSTLELTGRFCFAPDLLRYCASNVNVKKLFNGCGPQYHLYSRSDSVRYGSNAQVEHYGLKGRLVPYLFKPNPSISNLTNMFTHCKFISSYVKERVDESGSKLMAYPIPESFVKYLTSKSLDLTETFMGWYFPANTDLNVFKNDNSVNYTLKSTFKWPLFSNRICTSESIESSTFMNFPATEVYGIFNDGRGYVRAGDIGQVFCASQAQTDKETSTLLVRNQSVRFSGVFSSTGYIIGTDEYCFAGYTNPLAESADWGIRFPSKSVRTDKEFRNYIEYESDPLPI